jgi:superfamily II DNA helicase RecQ
VIKIVSCFPGNHCFPEFNIASAIDSLMCYYLFKYSKLLSLSVAEILSRMLNKTGFVKPLKDCQKECLMRVLSKNDVMAILPTGYGKRLIFELVAFAFCSITSVLKPPCKK